MDKLLWTEFVWTDEYSVGIKVIDEQHRQFFGIANSIIRSLGAKISRGALLASLGELGDYAFYHLGTEESYFDKFEYKDAPSHVAAHDQYRKKIGEFFDQTKNKKTDIKKLAGEMASYSSDWLMNHISLVDKKYTVFFKEHGL
ncbi:MAG: bacteriohemerythrin [Patescibacteria group bacterium]